MRTAALLVLLALSAPLAASADEEPAPPIVFDTQGHGHVRDEVPAPELPVLRFGPKQGELRPLYAPPWWYRAWWEYDPAGLYLFGDPYYGRKYLNTLERIQYPGWCP